MTTDSTISGQAYLGDGYAHITARIQVIPDDRTQQTMIHILQWRDSTEAIGASIVLKEQGRRDLICALGGTP